MFFLSATANKRTPNAQKHLGKVNLSYTRNVELSELLKGYTQHYSFLLNCFSDHSQYIINHCLMKNSFIMKRSIGHTQDTFFFNEKWTLRILQQTTHDDLSVNKYYGDQANGKKPR